jgi:putative heme-binding domain-containing protein
MNAFLKAAVFTVAICASYIYIGIVITDISGGSKAGVKIEGVSVEAGEQIFWGNGKCHTCHSVGTKGSAIRAPNLGVTDDFPLPIALRAEERAKELSAKLGKPFTAADYLVSSHYDPGLYVVEGFKNEMPTAWKPPIFLSIDEILAVDLYLQTMGGEPDQGALTASPYFVEMKKASASLDPSAVVEFKPYLVGDPERGMQIFFDPGSKAPCAKCHAVGDKGGKVGPELTNVAGTRDIHYIIESVLDPSVEIVSGFEPFLVMTEDGELIAGVRKAEDEQSITLVDNDGTAHVIAKDQIARMKEQTKSLMPDNFKELLSVEEFHDLLAYLQTLQ